jgi:hypothetical protein
MLTVFPDDLFLVCMPFPPLFSRAPAALQPRPGGRSAAPGGDSTGNPESERGGGGLEL